MKHKLLAPIIGLVLMAVAVIAIPGGTTALAVTGNPATYTLDADFDEGTLINVVHDPSDQLQLDETTGNVRFPVDCRLRAWHCRQNRHVPRQRRHDPGRVQVGARWSREEPFPDNRRRQRECVGDQQE